MTTPMKLGPMFRVLAIPGYAPEDFMGEARQSSGGGATQTGYLAFLAYLMPFPANSNV